MADLGKALSEEAGQEIVKTLRSMFGAGLKIEGLQIQLLNGQATPAIIATLDIPVVTQSANGAMSSTDKTKLDGIASGANKTVVDSSMSATSTNPVQNKVVDSALAAKAPIASPTFTGTPKATTPASSDNSTRIATTAFVTSAISAALTGSMRYKGAAASFSAITGTSYKIGWYWIVSTAGTFAGQSCEVGDMVVANSDKGSAASNDHFDIIQSNIDYVTADDVKTWFA